jgi:hypothetical protein
MTMRAVEFVENWVSENIDEDAAEAGDVDALAAELAAKCLEAADAEGIPRSEIDDTFDDLAAFIAGEIEESEDRDEPDDEDEELEDDEEDE